MKHQYEDYIKWIDDELLFLDNCLDERGWESKTEKNYRASLLANKATLERHKGYEAENVRGALLICRADEDLFPCPSLLDVTNQLDLVMGE